MGAEAGRLFLLHLGGGEVVIGHRAYVEAFDVLAHGREQTWVRQAQPGLLFEENDLRLFVERRACCRFSGFAGTMAVEWSLDGQVWITLASGLSFTPTICGVGLWCNEAIDAVFHSLTFARLN